jgi:hypothetical protein
MNTPTLADLKAYLGLEDSDTTDDVALQESLDAALAAQRRVVAYPCDEFGDPVFTDDLVLAVLLRSQRYVARRNSPEGVVGLSGAGGDFAAARVPSYDVDVLHLESSHLRIPVA